MKHTLSPKLSLAEVRLLLEAGTAGVRAHGHRQPSRPPQLQQSRLFPPHSPHLKLSLQLHPPPHLPPPGLVLLRHLLHLPAVLQPHPVMLEAMVNLSSISITTIEPTTVFLRLPGPTIWLRALKRLRRLASMLTTRKLTPL